MSKEVDRPGQCLPHGHRDSDDDGKEAPYVGMDIIYKVSWSPQLETLYQLVERRQLTAGLKVGVSWCINLV